MKRALAAAVLAACLVTMAAVAGVSGLERTQFSSQPETGFRTFAPLTTVPGSTSSEAVAAATGTPTPTKPPSPTPRLTLPTDLQGAKALTVQQVPIPTPTPKPVVTPAPVVPPAPVAPAAPPAPVAAVPTVADAQAYALNQLGSTQYACIDQIFIRESGWNPKAMNPSSGAYGIPQALPGSKMAIDGADWQYNPVTQVKWGIGYVNGSYGSACNAWAFWQAHGWY